jgi:hypothetical protein
MKADETAIKKKLSLFSRIFFIEDSRLVPEAAIRIGLDDFFSFLIVLNCPTFAANMAEFFSQRFEKCARVAITFRLFMTALLIMRHESSDSAGNAFLLGVQSANIAEQSLSSPNALNSSSSRPSFAKNVLSQSPSCMPNPPVNRIAHKLAPGKRFRKKSAQ